MPGAHRNGDLRFCGATTIVTGQSTVRVNGQLWAVEGDKNSHGEGALVATTGALNVRIGGKKVICAVGDTAEVDLLGHIPGQTDPSGSSGNVNVY